MRDTLIERREIENLMRYGIRVFYSAFFQLIARERDVPVDGAVEWAAAALVC